MLIGCVCESAPAFHWCTWWVDDVMTWKCFRHHWLCERNPAVTGGFPSQSLGLNVMKWSGSRNSDIEFLFMYIYSSYFHYSYTTWVSWGLKWSTTRLYVHQLHLANSKECIKPSHHWPFVAKWTPRWFPSLRACNAANISISWCHHNMTAA